MTLIDRAKPAAPYLQQLFYDQEVQDAIGRATVAARDAYGRARGKNARQLASDKKLHQRVQQALAAGWEAWSEVAEPPRPKRRWRLWLIGLSVVGAGVFMASNSEARARALGVLGTKPADGENPSDSENLS